MGTAWAVSVVLLCACAASGQFTHAAAASQLPSIVAARIAEDKMACGSAPAILKPGFITEKDINGDGKPDYILDYQYLICGSLPGFCGSGGCSAVVFASHNGTYVKVLDDLVGKVEFKTVGGRPAMLLLQRGGRSTMIWNGHGFSPAR